MSPEPAGSPEPTEPVLEPERPADRTPPEPAPTEPERPAGRAGRARRRRSTALFAAALLVAVGGLIYELILGTAASYLIGDSVLSFSLATGITLFGMGTGSLLAGRLRGRPATVFAANEILLGLVGGNSVLILYAAFGLTRIHWWVFSAVSLLIGVLIGLEIPPLVASLIFPLVLLPQLGLLRGAYLVGALTVAVAMVVLRHVDAPRRLVAAGAAAVVVLMALFCGAGHLERGIDARTYGDPIIYYEQSQYQKIVLTQYGQDMRLYLNGQLQFSSLDEARYHETLAAGAMTSVNRPARVLILGGGDGLLAREVLRYPGVEQVTVVDIDPAVTDLAATNPRLVELNGGSLNDPRVRVVNRDAFGFTAEGGRTYDVVLIDLVDPSNEKPAKLYSVEFYRRVEALLSEKGVMVTQATSSFFSPRAFSTVASTVAAGQPGSRVLPFAVNVPSFGEWGFVLSTRAPDLVLSHPLPGGLRYQTMEEMRFIVLDHPARTSPMEPSTLLRPTIVQVYNDDMAQWRYS